MTKITYPLTDLTSIRQVKRPEPVTAPRPTASVIRQKEAAPGPPAMNVEQFLQRYNQLPAHTAALGYCEDGLPVLFDFSDASAGPVLVVGDRSCGKTNLVKVLLRSAAHASSPRQFKFVVISSRPEEYAGLNGKDPRTSHCMNLVGSYDTDAGKTIIRMAELAEERYTSRISDPLVLVAFDDLKFITTADTDVRLNFEWLLRHGPDVRVWPVVALTTETALDMGRWIAYFRTRILGHMPEKASNRLGMYPGSGADRLQPGKQFGVRVDNAWMRFWVPADLPKQTIERRTE